MAAHPSNSFQRPLQNAMRIVKVAIQLDTGSRHKEAYCEYLRSINYISHALLENAEIKQEGEIDTVEVDKMVKLAEQCLERVKSCLDRSHEFPAPASSSTPTPQNKQTTIPAINVTNDPKITETRNEPAKVSETESKPQANLQPTRHRRVLSEGGQTASPFLPPEVFQKLQIMESQDNKKGLSPIEEASRLNQKLKANYEARLARLSPGQAIQKTSLTLSLQRQMMENLIIAKARQDALQRKMEERRLRLQEEANRRFATCNTMTPEEQEQRVLYARVLEYEQDHEWPKAWKARLKKSPNDPALVSGLICCLLSCPDHPVMQLLRRLQYRVYNRLYPIVSQRVPLSPMPARSQTLKPSRSAQSLLLSDSPMSSQQQQSPLKSNLTHSLSDASFSFSPSRDHNANDAKSETDPDEPSSLVATDRENSFEDLEKFLTQLDWVPSQCSDDTDSDMNFDSTHVEVESHIQDLEERALKEHLKSIVKDIHNAIDRLLSLCLLSFECLNTAISKDQCVASIEEVFFTPIWRPLLALFRWVHREREMAVESNMRLYSNVSPADIGVASKLFPRDPAVLHGSYPYETAVQELNLLCRDYCPQKKLECIVRTLRMICACAEEYRLLQENDPTPKSAAIGADDLLPILAFVALRSEMPQLVSECAALEEFIHEGYLIGEEGYCLTSLQSALTYVESLVLGGDPPPAAKPT
ncbi:VPS9 domain-containing protein 1 5-day ovary-specific transcript 1 protein [Triplophysa tibetana]|uniref:VPS9 domain-containing protein 1 5-day ovary-specific transcript 1 protein n=1 Tax=Triplophysa tibetana TaxID=1572043 RepID=A0A5A9P220_9TELE|nr:VPS9 domain-containing protein 1 5-day ovary-specific transcript 1 protein [Triplophysa tibetana]